ncbi:MAG: DUF4435 domain-containing protein [Bacteroidaceae bacterium]|nr:DUF4435 domain-containing protein [Bacteroidaceae bacterium]
MKRLTEYLNSSFIEAANALRPKHAAQRIIAYVESYDDISFWRSVFNEYESEKVHFEIMLPARTKLTKGKKQAMMNMLGKSGYGRNMIACVDSDYDYLLQGATSTSRQMLGNKYILHTRAYSIENYRCYAGSLKQVCVLCTQNDSNVIDFNEFYKLYSRICFPLFVWNILLYRKHDTKTMSMLRFCEIVRLSSFTLSNPAYSLQQLGNRVAHNIKLLEKQFPGFIEEHRKMADELTELGVDPDETYFYIQGHHIMNGVTMRIMQPVCRHLRSKREEEIERYAYHRQQYNNELASYRHSQCDVATMLNKNTDYKNATPYQRLKADIDRLIKDITANL